MRLLKWPKRYWANLGWFCGQWEDFNVNYSRWEMENHIPRVQSLSMADNQLAHPSAMAWMLRPLSFFLLPPLPFEKIRASLFYQRCEVGTRIKGDKIEFPMGPLHLFDSSSTEPIQASKTSGRGFVLRSDREPGIWAPLTPESPRKSCNHYLHCGFNYTPQGLRAG